MLQGGARSAAPSLRVAANDMRRALDYGWSALRRNLARRESWSVLMRSTPAERSLRQTDSFSGVAQKRTTRPAA